VCGFKQGLELCIKENKRKAGRKGGRKEGKKGGMKKKK
jgi:hypothetical protein